MPKVYLRKAEWADVDLLYEWANDSEVRNNSFNIAKIGYEEHKTWFKNSLRDKDVDLYICYLDSMPIGQIRLNYTGETAAISYSIADKYRGQGFGKIIIKLIEAEVVAAYPKVKFLSGSVKLDNVASQRIFEENDFARQIVVEPNNKFYRYCKQIEQKNIELSYP